MKTSIKTLIAAFLTITLSAATPAVKAADVNATTTLTNVKNINKIIVTGNVALILVQSFTESVKVYDTYYSKNALVQQEDGVLRISSFNKEKLSVVVNVKDLNTVEASNTSSVITFNKFNALELHVHLKDNATADINTAAILLYTSVTDKASLQLAGSATEYSAVMGATSNVKMDQFVAESSNIRSVKPVYAAKINLAKESIEDIIAKP